jgi:hypothetical protein
VQVFATSRLAIRKSSAGRVFREIPPVPPAEQEAGRSIIPQSSGVPKMPARSTQVLVESVLTFFRNRPGRRGTRGLPGPLRPGQKRLTRSGPRTCPAQTYSAPVFKNRGRCGTMRETTVANSRPRPAGAGRACRRRSAGAGRAADGPPVLATLLCKCSLSKDRPLGVRQDA